MYARRVRTVEKWLGWTREKRRKRARKWRKIAVKQNYYIANAYLILDLPSNEKQNAPSRRSNSRLTSISLIILPFSGFLVDHPLSSPPLPLLLLIKFTFHSPHGNNIALHSNFPTRRLSLVADSCSPCSDRSGATFPPPRHRTATECVYLSVGGHHHHPHHK